MSRINAENGTTEMILEEIERKTSRFSEIQRDRIRDVLDNITLDNFLTALVADTDLKEVVMILDTFHAGDGRFVRIYDEDENIIYPKFN